MRKIDNLEVVQTSDNITVNGADIARERICNSAHELTSLGRHSEALTVIFQGNQNPCILNSNESKQFNFSQRHDLKTSNCQENPICYCRKTNRLVSISSRWQGLAFLGLPLFWNEEKFPLHCLRVHCLVAFSKPEGTYAMTVEESTSHQKHEVVSFLEPYFK